MIEIAINIHLQLEREIAINILQKLEREREDSIKDIWSKSIYMTATVSFSENNDKDGYKHTPKPTSKETEKD